MRRGGQAAAKCVWMTVTAMMSDAAGVGVFGVRKFVVAPAFVVGRLNVLDRGRRGARWVCRSWRECPRGVLPRHRELTIWDLAATPVSRRRLVLAHGRC